MTHKEKALEWIASSYKDLMALPPDVRRRFGYALSLAQMGDQDDAAKVLKGFGGAGVLEVVEDDAGGTVPGRLHGEVRGSSVRPALLPEEEQEGDPHTKLRYGHHSRSAESGVGGTVERKTGLGVCHRQTSHGYSSRTLPPLRPQGICSPGSGQARRLFVVCGIAQGSQFAFGHSFRHRERVAPQHVDVFV